MKQNILEVGLNVSIDQLCLNENQILVPNWIPNFVFSRMVYLCDIIF